MLNILPSVAEMRAALPMFLYYCAFEIALLVLLPGGTVTGPKTLTGHVPEYKEALKAMPKNIDWEQLRAFEFEDNTTGSQELACVGGACELT